MVVIGKTDEGFLISRIQQAGPNPYDATSRPTIVFNDFKHRVEEVISVEITALVADNGAFLAHNAGLVAATRTMTLMVTAEDNTDVDGAPHREVVSGDSVDLSGKNFVAIAIGR